MAILTALVSVGAIPTVSAANDPVVIQTLAGDGTEGFGGDGGLANQAQVSLPFGIAVDAAGNAYIADAASHRIRRVDASTGTISTVAGSTACGPCEGGFSGDGGPAIEAELHFPTAVHVDPAGNLYISDQSNHRVRRVDASTGTISTVAGSTACPPCEGGFSGDGGPAIEAELHFPAAVHVDPAGNLYISDQSNHRVRMVAAGDNGTIEGDDVITTVAGMGPQEDGFGAFGSGDGGDVGDGRGATEAHLNYPFGLALDSHGNLYIADLGNNRVRMVAAGDNGKIDGDDVIATVAGTGEWGASGDGEPAAHATLRDPSDVVLDAAGNLYIADSGNHRIRRVDRSGRITTFAGNGADGYGGDGQAPTEAQLNLPWGVAVDAAGNLVLADTWNRRIRRVGPDLLDVTMRDAPDPVASGTTLTHTATVRNVSDMAATGVTLTGAPPPGAALMSVDVSQGSCGEAGAQVSCALGSLGPGATATVVLTLEAPALDPAAQPLQIASVVTAGAVEADPFPLDDHARVTTTVRVPADLSAALEDAPDTVGVGQTVAYALSVRNDGPGKAEMVAGEVLLPPGATIVGVQPSRGVRCSGPDSFSAILGAPPGLSCQFGDLDSGEAATGTVEVLAPVRSGDHTATLTVWAATPDVVSGNDTATAGTNVSTVAIPGELGVANEAFPDPATAGEPLTYTLTAVNGRSQPVTAVTLTDVLPAGVALGSVSATQGACSGLAGRTVTCALGTLGAGARATVRIRATPLTASAAIVNTATVESNETPPASSAATTAVSGVGCGRVITASIALTADVGPCAGPGLIVGANGISLDLAGHLVFGFPGPGDGNQAGIVIPRRKRVTVKNGTVSGFDAGVVLAGGTSNVVRGLTVVDNIGPPTSLDPLLGDGIFVARSANNLIEGNTVLHNGNYDGIGVWGRFADRNVIRGNTVERTVTDSAGILGPNGQGIVATAVLDPAVDRGAMITGTRIEGNIIRRSAFSGISNINSVDGRIVGNTVLDNGVNGVGNGIGLQLGPDVSDVRARIVVERNEIHGNLGDGIQVNGGVERNRIRYNEAANNALLDLNDLNPGCDRNEWLGNVWGTGGYAPECAARGGRFRPVDERPPAGPDADALEPVPSRPPLFFR